jgi:ABC-type uncharacterized transport system fused permease/ATPase subunit
MSVSLDSDASATGTRPRSGGHLVSEMLMMFRITSPQHTKIRLLGTALVLVIAATAFGQIRLNAWNRPFYDALAHRDLHAFLGSFIGVLWMLSGNVLNMSGRSLTIPGYMNYLVPGNRGFVALGLGPRRAAVIRKGDVRSGPALSAAWNTARRSGLSLS